ncbi:MAG: protein-L-isoaspartate(D-aspartate) O-methyltransferase [Parcubacteria group bacterium LiPW_39]|nr:MAG: protein-L-isoaspartate(D-aspartate) O-methyltransferase [Parcubacteria group bacterium LiPW_39]
MINELISQHYLKTPLIIEAFKNINRADFLPDDLKDEAGVNAPLPIGFGQTNSQPLTVAFMLELLQPQAGEKILDIGSGSGWTSALLAWCVGEDGKVLAIERIPELCEFGKQNIAKYNYIVKGVVKIICADGAKGLPEEAPFDKIIAAAAADSVPPAWKEQLRIGGQMILPIKDSIWLLKKKSVKDFEEKEFYGFAFVPLIAE